MTRRLPALMVLGVAAACGRGATPSAKGAGTLGASIAVIQAGAALAVVNADQGSVSLLDPASLAVTQTVTVQGEPHALLELASGTLLVANYRGGQIVAVDPSTGTVTGAASVCAGPYGLAESPDHTWVAVSCEWDGTVQKVDPATLTATPIAQGLHRPRAVAIVGQDVYVADYVGGTVHDIHPDGSDSPTSLVPSAAPYRPALTKMTANLASSIAVAFGRVHVAHVLENNDGDTSEAVAANYGTVSDTNPKINPAVTTLGTSTPPIYAQFDGGSRVYSGAVAVASFGSHYLLVAHVSTANVAVIDTTAATPDGRAVATYTVGAGPAGVAVDEASQVAYVDNALDQSVSRIDLAQPFAPGAPVYTPEATLVRTLPSPYSTQALAGRRLFFDATNTHVTPAGVVACASCHPSGSDDGLVWFEDTPNVPYRHRRTPHLANAKSATSPFHWDGQFTDMPALAESTMTNIMGGDGLLVDVSTVQAYIDEIVQPPVLPVADAASVARGEALFTSPQVGCSTCHDGPYLTDDQLHVVLNPQSLDPADTIAQTNTPGLHGVFLTAPYFHDGRAATLQDVLADPLMGSTQGLSAQQTGDLIAYLQSL
ncbi:MAG TPA: hypothetical protein VGG39_31545 [Polyangiaceae bacterium]|jgi:YVTN family beta-propeller protein